LSAIQELRGYYDLFLITTAGDVVYTAFKEADFASNLLVGKWSKSGLARVFGQAMDQCRARRSSHRCQSLARNSSY